MFTTSFYIYRTFLGNMFPEGIFYSYNISFILELKKKVREKSRECHSHKPQPFPDSQTQRGRGNRQIRRSTNRTNVRKALRLALSSPSEVIAILKGLKKHKNKMTHGKTYNKSPRRINHKATKSKTNTGTTALERSVE